MRSCRLLILAVAAASGAAHALSIDGDTQLHAAVGQALSASVPISLAGDEVSRLYYRLTPGADLPDAEERAAASVHAAYDPQASAIVLSTGARVNVPALRLHLEVGAGSVVVSRDLTVLFDIPDLSQSAPLEAAPAASKAPAAQPDAAPGAPEGARGIAITREEAQKAARTFGDAAAQPAPASAPAGAAPAAASQLVVVPRPRYFNTYQVKKGDTLESVGAHFARAGAGSLDAVMLAIYEANYDAFPAGDPNHPLVGRQLEIPDAPSIGSEPGYRIAEFRDYLRKPIGEWQVPVNLQRRKVEAPAEAPKTALPGWLQLHNVVGAAALLLVLWGLRVFLRGGAHKRAVRRARLAGAPPAVAPNLVQPAPAAPREQAVELVTPPPPETEQAEISRLRELLRQQPMRADIRLRLAQRLFEARRAAGFAEVALPLEQVLSPEAWERVRMMGHELLPSDFRFAPQAGFAPAPELVSLMEKQGGAQPAAPAAGGAATIDFDFHGEMARVDKARSDVFGDGGGQAV